MIRTILAVLLFLYPLVATAASPTRRGTIPAINPERAVIINGPIGNGNLTPLIAPMQKMIEAGRGPIDLIINSPGGEIVTGFLFLNVMENVKAQGVRIRCYVPTLAASMAFQILVHCSERYTLDRAFLLWHRVRVQIGGGLFSIGVAMTAPMARDLAFELEMLDNVILQEVTEAFDGEMKESRIRRHFEKETLHVGETLASVAPGFITSAPAIDGLFDVLLNPKVPRTGPFAGAAAAQPDGTLIYAHPIFWGK